MSIVTIDRKLVWKVEWITEERIDIGEQHFRSTPISEVGVGRILKYPISIK